MAEYKLLVTHLKDRLVSALYEEKRPVQWTVEDGGSNQPQLGGIYIGRVKNIVKNINAAFVEISEGIECYLPLDYSGYPAMQSPRADGRLCMGDTLVVQVERETMKTKQAAVTVNFNLTGKYAVLVHGKPVVGVSLKITDSIVREELKTLFSDFTGENIGWIVRTNAENADRQEIADEAKRLLLQYKNILEHGIHYAAFSVLKGKEPNYLSCLKESYSKDIKEIVTDDEQVYNIVEEYLTNQQKKECMKQNIKLQKTEKKKEQYFILDDEKSPIKLRLYQDEITLSNLYSLERHLKEHLDSKVWLKSGASLVIEPTEALTVIDVNTGKAVKERGDKEKHFLKINMEAAAEIAYQIRARNLSGIILIDFIGTKDEEKKQELLLFLREQLLKDPVRTVLVDMTPLQLVEITRKKVYRPLHEEFLPKTD